MAKILIRKVIEEKGIKVSHIVPFIPMSRSTLYKIFDGAKSPTIDELEEIAKILNVPVEDLYQSEYSRKPNES